MPLSAKSEKILNKMISKYGKKKGTSIFYATANKRGLKPETWSESKIKLVDNLIVESCGLIILISSGSDLIDYNKYFADKIIQNGIELDIANGCFVTDCDHNIKNFPELVGHDISDIMDYVFEITDNENFITDVKLETVSTGGIAYKPSSLENNKDDEDEEMDESSNSQISKLNLDH